MADDLRRVELEKSRVMLLWLMCSLLSLSVGQAVLDDNLNAAVGAVNGAMKPAYALKQNVREQGGGGLRSQSRINIDIGLANQNGFPNPIDRDAQNKAPGADTAAVNPKFNVLNSPQKPPQNFVQPRVNNNPPPAPVQPQPQNNQVQGGLRKSTTIKLVDHPACKGDVKAYCASATNNFAILDCLQNDLKSDQDISVECQHVVWNYIRNLTTDIRFESAAKEICKDELNKFPECKSIDGGVGHVIPCLIEYKANITIPNCRYFLTKMGAIIGHKFGYMRSSLA